MKGPSFFILCFMSLLLMGCFAKKKRSYAKGAARNSERSTREKNGQDSATPFTFNSAEDYIATFAPIAIEEMEQYGIPASITLAQGLLESGAGSSHLVKKSNNHFGIKCHTTWKGLSTTHDDDQKGECFRKYIHPRESYRDHSLFLINGRRYAFLFDYKITDYKSWAEGLRTAGYATDPKYPAKLIKQIENYRLDQYDQPKALKRLSRRQVSTAQTKQQLYTEQSANSQSFYKVQNGDTLFSISKKYGLKVRDLQVLNDLEGTTIREGDQLKISLK
jgi:flagellum-specific peptidoglycan hydrolase FlgJ